MPNQGTVSMLALRCLLHCESTLQEMRVDEGKHHDTILAHVHLCVHLHCQQTADIGTKHGLLCGCWCVQASLAVRRLWPSADYKISLD